MSHNIDWVMFHPWLARDSSIGPANGFRCCDPKGEWNKGDPKGAMGIARDYFAWDVGAMFQPNTRLLKKNKKKGIDCGGEVYLTLKILQKGNTGWNIYRYNITENVERVPDHLRGTGYGGNPGAPIARGDVNWTDGKGMRPGYWVNSKHMANLRVQVELNGKYPCSETSKYEVVWILSIVEDDTGKEVTLAGDPRFDDAYGIPHGDLDGRKQRKRTAAEERTANSGGIRFSDDSTLRAFDTPGRNTFQSSCYQVLVINGEQRLARFNEYGGNQITDGFRRALQNGENAKHRARCHSPRPARGKSPTAHRLWQEFWDDCHSFYNKTELGQPPECSVGHLGDYKSLGIPDSFMNSLYGGQGTPNEFGSNWANGQEYSVINNRGGRDPACGDCGYGGYGYGGALDATWCVNYGDGACDGAVGPGGAAPSNWAEDGGGGPSSDSGNCKYVFNTGEPEPLADGSWTYVSNDCADGTECPADAADNLPEGLFDGQFIYTGCIAS